MADNFRYFQAPPSYSLAGSGAVIGATTITLKSMTDIDGTALTMAGTFGTKGFGTMEPGNGTLEEQISFTGLTNNANGTVTLTGVSSVTFAYPYTETSGLLKTHAGSTSFVISNTSGYYNEFLGKDNDETANGIIQFVQAPRMTAASTPTLSTELVPKSYVDSVAGGIATTNQIIIGGTSGEALTVGNAVYQSVADGKWYKTDADSGATADGVLLGIAQATVSSNASVNVCIAGLDTNQSGLVAGSLYYLSGTAGAISATPGTISVLIGEALSTTQLIVSQRFTQVPTALEKAQIPTAGEKNALVGDNTTIAVGTGNKYVTQTGLQNASEVYAVATGAGTAYLITLSPTPTAYAAGQTFRFKSPAANIGTSPTLNVNGLGAKNILKLAGSTSPAVGDIGNGQVITVIYDGTNFQMGSPVAQTVSLGLYKNGSATKDVADASTTQNIAHGLGIVPKNVRLFIASAATGNTTPVGYLAVSYNGTTTSVAGAQWEAAGAFTQENNAFNVGGASGSSGYQAGVVTWDATNIIITWTKNATPTGTATIMWEAMA